MVVHGLRPDLSLAGLLPRRGLRVRGRKPKPTVLHRLAGNPGKRPLNVQEPDVPAPSAEFDTPPEELKGDTTAESEWRRTVPMLRDRKIISEAERGVLIALCQQWSIYQQAVQKWNELGMIVKAPSGYPMVNPYIGVANHALGHCSKLWAELGLTPSSRTRVRVLEDGGAKDAFSEFDGLKILPGGRK